jgi:hypothetical protein
MAGDSSTVRIVTRMRSSRSLSSPSLSALVRSVLLTETHEILESHPPGADEAVIVGDSHLDTRTPEETGYAAAYREQDRRREVGAKKTSAYMGTDRWKEAVKRRYALLDKHPLVRDVVVKPIGSAHGFNHERRAQVVSHEEARRLVLETGGTLPEADSHSIIFIPIGGKSLLSPDELPSPWVTVHAIFDDFKVSLKGCNSLVTEISSVLDSISANNTFGGESVRAADLLLNCGWSENAFHMVTAAAAKRGARDGRLDTHLDDLRPPTIGKRYKNSSDVPLKTSKSTSSTLVTGASYVMRSTGDIVAEIMTIAVTKSEGLKPVLSRLPLLPDDTFRSIILRQNFYHDKGEFSPDEKREAQLNNISPATRKKAERLVVEGLERISGMTRGALDLFVQDLLGKAIIVLI